MLFNADIEINGTVQEVSIYAKNLKQAKINAAEFGRLVKISRMRKSLAEQLQVLEKQN